jgi:hypothetical protein
VTLSGTDIATLTSASSSIASCASGCTRFLGWRRSIASSLPLTPVPDRRLEAAGAARFATAAAPVVSTVTIGSGYFSALGLSLIGGREFGDSQDAASGPASAGEAIVNQRFADTYFAGKNPIGQSITLGAQPPSKAGSDVLTIVGVSPTLTAPSPGLERSMFRMIDGSALASLIVRNSTTSLGSCPCCVGSCRRRRTFLSIASRRCGR